MSQVPDLSGNGTAVVETDPPKGAPVVGGVYSLTPPTLEDGKSHALLLDASGRLVVSVTTTDGSAQEIQGTVADGSAAAGNPVQIGGKDGSGNIQTILTGTDGSVNATVGGAVAHDAPASGNPVPCGGIYRTAFSTTTALDRTEFITDAYGNQRVATVGVGSSAISGITLNGNIAFNSNLSSSTVYPQLVLAAVHNGTTGDIPTKSNAVYRILSAAASTNGANIKASAGNVHGIKGNVIRASKVYLKLYNKATAPTVGTDVPVLTFALSASAQFDIDLGTYGHYFSAGIGIALTTAAADADTGALTAGDVECLMLRYS